MRVEGQGRLNKADPTRHIVIAGAGIGGLTAALALARDNFYVTVLEKSAQLTAAGAGIQLSPNASRILVALGLGDALAACAVTPDCLSVTTARSGGEAARIPLGKAMAARYGAPYWIVHRSDLQAALLARVTETPSIDLKLGATVVNVASDASGVTIGFEQNGVRSGIQAAVLIGADGIHSVVRQYVQPNRSAQFSGKVAWRSLIDATALLTPPGNRIALWLAPDAHVVAYPVRDERINVVAITSGTASVINAPQSKLPDTFHRGHVRAPLRAIIEKATDWTAWPLHSVNAPLWREGRVALLGDAAHAMMPFVAQGAAMAIEDAAVLAQCLSRWPDDSPAALQNYALARQPRLARIRQTAIQTGAIYHMSGPMAFARDLSMKILGGKRLLARQQWIYGWTP